jgi:hypothetical protein
MGMLINIHDLLKKESAGTVTTECIIPASKLHLMMEHIAYSTSFKTWGLTNKVDTNYIEHQGLSNLPSG